MERATQLHDRIRGKQLLGDGRLSIIFGNEPIGFSMIYDYSMLYGTGLGEVREALRKRLEDMEEADERGQRARLELSSQGRFVFVNAIWKTRTHNMHFTQPEVIVDEVKWVQIHLARYSHFVRISGCC